MSTLYELTGDYQELLNLVQAGEYTEEELADTLEGIEGEIEIKADGYAKIIKELEADTDKFKKEESRLKEKRQALESSIKRLKSNLEKSMILVNKKKFKTDLFSFNIQKNPPSLIIDGEVPEEYLIPQEPKIDNAKIKELLKTQELAFATLRQGESLRIR